jgi:succinoglycan biosynthesis transport protein ExoP
MKDTDPVTSAFVGLASRVDALGSRSVGFTSALLGEGVSTLALGTALALARLREETVLLVDANSLQPSLTRDAHLESSPGLADCLANKAHLGDVIRLPSRSPLAFLPAGTTTAAKPTLRTVSSLLTNDLAAYGTVVVDLPPILAGESVVLPWAALLDQVFLVLREAATPVPLLREALSKLGLATEPRVVLNRAMAPSADVALGLLPART